MHGDMAIVIALLLLLGLAGMSFGMVIRARADGIGAITASYFVFIDSFRIPHPVGVDVCLD